MTYDIGDTINVRVNAERTVRARIVSRNWAFSSLLSYVVRVDGRDIPVDPRTMRAQLLCN